MDDDCPDVSTFWDGLLVNERAMPDPVDPTTAHTVRHLRTLAAAPLPASARERVRRGVQAPRPPQHHDEETTMSALSTPWPTHPNGVAGPAPAPRPGARLTRTPAPQTAGQGVSRRREFSVNRLGLVAVSAMVVLVLAAGFAAFDRSDLPWSNRSNLPGGYLAAVDPATPPPATVSGESLLTATLEAAWLPPGTTVVEFSLMTLAPGFSADQAQPSGALPPGMRLDYVVAGSYAVRSQAQVVVLRGAGAGGSPVPPETVEPGTEVVLTAGDAAILTDVAAGHTLANPGGEPSLVLLASLAEAAASGPPAIATDVKLLDVEQATLVGPVTAALSRVRLDAGATWPGTTAGGLQVSGADPRTSPDGRLSTGSAGSVTNRGAEAVDVWVLTIEPEAAGTPVPVGSPAP